MFVCLLYGHDLPGTTLAVHFSENYSGLDRYNVYVCNSLRLRSCCNQSLLLMYLTFKSCQTHHHLLLWLSQTVWQLLSGKVNPRCLANTFFQEHFTGQTYVGFSSKWKPLGAMMRWRCHIAFNKECAAFKKHFNVKCKIYL